MEVASHCSASDVTEVNKDPNQSECIVSQPTANGTITHHATEEAPPPLSHRLEDDSSDDSLTDSSYTNDISRLLPAPPTFALRKQRGVDGSSVSPVCTPPSSSTCSRHHESTNQKQLSSTKSHTSFKTDAAHIKEVAGDDGFIKTAAQRLLLDVFRTSCLSGDKGPNEGSMVVLMVTSQLEGSG
ncbi:uncharacterized protein LOC127534510 isoform X2 [Acanthochromis polyacanthus]|uniref:uncharacterized protein LOC110966540 isoform X2 n=1 Tax=Acanthochromis polyacanthus TaxID=80966 RepID=UPI00223434C2|nr:uncharacterized protein LOC110966540 isoform X2 [Acanthochromis polyacanthus]XP_051805794.1 uncharacterized protein LOC127534510 isoform X2 [Acanthochromis polyacanthus]